MWSMTLEPRPSASSLMRWITLRSTFSVGCAAAGIGQRRSRGAISSVFRIIPLEDTKHTQAREGGAGLPFGYMNRSMHCRFLCALALLSTAFASTAFAADSGVWKVAPAPPASWQRDRVADLTARRKAVMDQIGEHAVLILYAAEARNYANDVEWPFRQE